MHKYKPGDKVQYIGESGTLPYLRKGDLRTVRSHPIFKDTLFVGYESDDAPGGHCIPSMHFRPAPKKSLVERVIDFVRSNNE